MKSLTILRKEGSDRAHVECAMGIVSVHTKCGYCKHCRGIKVGARVMPSPYEKAGAQIQSDSLPPEAYMEAALTFNTLVRDGSEVVCDDDKNTGYVSRY